MSTSKAALKSVVVKKNFGQPDEVRSVDKGKIEVININDRTLLRMTFEPGWRWTNSIKSVVGTDTCQASHLGYLVSGRMIVKMDDGKETELLPGDLVAIPPGHDGWVVGDEPAIFLDFQSNPDYARRSS